jgi:ribonuclease VapC
LILDSSALISLICRERGYERLLSALESASRVAIGAPTRLQAEAIIATRLGLQGPALLSLFLERAHVSVIAFDEEHRQVAASASARYGRRRHQAALSAFDCMTYATAHLADSPLLAVGTHFPLTDLPIAP